MTVSLNELFPPVERVMYQCSTLAQVVCQLRYPSLLKIQTELPAEFQSKIRDLFPLFERSQEAALLTGLPNELSVLVPPQGLEPKSVFHFTSEEKDYKLSLSEDSISLTTTKYTMWHEFKRRMQPALEALNTLYSPGFYSRIGLRYTNQINRSTLNIESVLWKDLIQDKILGELSFGQVGPIAKEAYGHIRLKLPDVPDSLFLRHGLQQQSENAEQEFFIDADFYTEEKTGVSDGPDVLDRLNMLAGRTFRWCIKDRLHTAMVPTPVDRTVLETA